MNFYAFVIKNDKDYFLKKLSFDKKSYFIVPPPLQNLNQHHMLKKSKSGILKGMTSNSYRHLNIPIFKSNGNYSDEYLRYVNKGGRFEIGGRILPLETERITRHHVDINVNFNESDVNRNSITITPVSLNLSLNLFRNLSLNLCLNL